MLEITASEFVKNFGQYKERAQREVIAVTSHGRTSGYFMSEQEYKLLMSQSRQAYHVSELSETTLAAIATAQMDSRHDHLNALMD
jgi:PHD/YefM family antitoxin component YafN of YafNO toxin-antitoxin module